MPAPSVSYNPPIDSELAPGKPNTSNKQMRMRDAIKYLFEWIGKDYTAAQNHNHDGVNSAEIEVGPNYVRNPSFEAGTTGWTTAAYTGGTVATNAANDMNGATALAMTSTSIANGGGEAIATGYTPCSGGMSLDTVAMVKASASGQSAKLSVIWYDDAKAQISEAAAWTSTSVPTVATPVGDRVVAPATARYARLKLVGGVPASGTAFGTVYWDGVLLTERAPIAVVGNTNVLATTGHSASTTSTSMVEALNFLAKVGGNLSVKYTLGSDNAGAFAEARVYVNGVATGTLRFASVPSAAYSDDVAVSPGDTVQIFIRNQVATHLTTLTAVSICSGNPRMVAGEVVFIPVGLRF